MEKPVRLLAEYDRFAAAAESMIMLFRDIAEPESVSLRNKFTRCREVTTAEVKLLPPDRPWPNAIHSTRESRLAR